MNYEFWKQSLAGEKPKMFVDDPQLGFYRKAIKQRDANGNSKRVGWLPVAIYLNEEKTIVARVGSVDMDGDDLNELWSYVAGHPITEAEYRSVEELGHDWSDAKVAEIPAANRDVAKSDNAAPVGPPEQAHAEAIDNAIKAAIPTVESETDAATALGSKNRIAELRLSCDHAGRIVYEPMYADYVKIRDAYQGPVKRADAEEKRLGKIILTFRESERQRIAKETAEAERKQRELDEANARAADRAIARGEAEQPPLVEEVAMPAPMAKIEPTYGNRALKEEVKLFLDKVTSWDMLFAHYKNNADVQALLMKLAGADIKVGRTVPGTTTREGLI
jgi:hypothetical protein